MHRIILGLVLPGLFAFGTVAPGYAGEASELHVTELLEVPNTYDGATELDGTDVGSRRVVWNTLHAAVGGTIAVHRPRERDMASPTLRLPLVSWIVSSPFGMRADPFHHRSVGSSTAMAATRLPLARRTGIDRVNVATPRGIALGLSAKGTGRPVSQTTRTMFMHEGVDFVAPSGTPVLAAGAGIVKGAEPNGSYGNWILIEHDSTELTTVYGHLASFAHGITVGTRVNQGELIGFVGNTGRSTGPHLHFELRVAGEPVNPMTHEAIKSVHPGYSDLANIVVREARSYKKPPGPQGAPRRSTGLEYLPYAL